MSNPLLSPTPELIPTPNPNPNPNPNPSLPDDLLLSCLARVSRLHYPALSLVSKSFRSLLASLELYKTRSLLNLTESCLYVRLRFPPDPNPRWFTLCRKPDQTLTSENEKSKEKKKKSKTKTSGYVLAMVPYESADIDRMIDLSFQRKLLFYQLIGQPTICFPFLDCVVENMLYRYVLGGFLWYDSKVGLWREVKGVKRLSPYSFGQCVKLAHYGGKMAVLWDTDECKNKFIWCAVIAFEKRDNNEEIWGEVEWLDVVLTVPNSYEFVFVLSAIV